eukprot:15478423-Alexandrium_andersonii.AAC.1
MGCTRSGAVRRAGVRRPAVPLRRRGTQRARARHRRCAAHRADRLAHGCADSWPHRGVWAACAACPCA